MISVSRRSRIRLGNDHSATLRTLILSGRLLLRVLAYSLSGRFPGSTVVVLAMIALALPIGIYCLATVGGWQRSLASGANPSGLTGWIIRSKLAPVLPIAFMFFLLGLLWNMDLTPLDQDAPGNAVCRGR